MSDLDLTAAVDILAPVVCHRGGHIPNRDRSLPGSCNFHRTEALNYLTAAAPLIEAQARVAALHEAVTAIVDAATSLNAELRQDGSEEPGMAAYVEGFHNAWAAVNALIPDPATVTS